MTFLKTLREEGRKNTIRLRRSAADRLADKILVMAARKERELRKKALEAEREINKTKAAKKREAKMTCRCNQDACTECQHRIRHRSINQRLRAAKKVAIESIPKTTRSTEILSLYFEELNMYTEKYAHRSSNSKTSGRRPKTVIPRGFQEVTAEIEPEGPRHHPWRIPFSKNYFVVDTVTNS